MDEKEGGGRAVGQVGGRLSCVHARMHSYTPTHIHTWSTGVLSMKPYVRPALCLLIWSSLLYTYVWITWVQAHTHETHASTNNIPASKQSGFHKTDASSNNTSIPASSRAFIRHMHAPTNSTSIPASPHVCVRRWRIVMGRSSGTVPNNNVGVCACFCPSDQAESTTPAMHLAKDE